VPLSAAAPAAAAAPIEPEAPAPPAPRKPLLGQAWINALAVAGLIAFVVLGGIGLDTVIAAPSAGKVALGDGVTMTAAPGWVKTENQGGLGIRLQQGSAVMLALATLSNATPSEALGAEKDGLRADPHVHDVAFGPEQSGKIGGRKVAMDVFTAILDAGTLDGEIICLSMEGRIVVIEVIAPQGYLHDADGDVATMIKSLEVGK
jgi:hypothetical protein